MKNKPDGTVIISKRLLEALVGIDPWAMRGRRTSTTEPQLICKACGGHMAWHGPEHRPDCCWCEARRLVGASHDGRTGDWMYWSKDEDGIQKA